MSYFLVTLGLCIFFAALVVVFTLKNGVSPMPTSVKVRNELIDHLPALKKKVIVDLGSGWGHLLFPLSKRYPSCKVIGYENSPLPYWFSSFFNHHHNVKVVRQNFFETSLCHADLVICYLFPKGMEKLKEKLQQELPAGSLVVSHTFAIPGWEPTKVIQVKDLYQSPIYFYQK
ncbi:MAG: methyltransferase [Chlamydiota bacterium]